ncbi:MAG: HAMP domain-containing sensor histidine kinase [Microthrixaceae bacterium]
MGSSSDRSSATGSTPGAGGSPARTKTPAAGPSKTPSKERSGEIQHSAAFRTFHRGSQIGLRGRITFAVTFVSLLISLILAFTTLAVGRSTLIDTREKGVTTQALANAETIRGGLAGAETSNLQTLLSSLPDTGSPSLIVTPSGSSVDEPTTVSLNPRYGVDTLPAAMVREVTIERKNSIMRFSARNEPLLAIGIAIPGSDASYFQIHSLEDINSALRTMRVGLVIVTIVATALAVVLSYWSSRYALKPLARIGEAAESVALGQLDTRIDYDDYVNDVDLAPLVANFNEMVSALEDRINRDARFASDVSHELRSPLTTLNASIEVLRNNRDVLPERSQRALDLLTLDMQRFTQLVEDLLEISRFDAGAVRLELDAVALVPTVTAAVRMASPDPIPVEATEEASELIMACDKRRLVRVLANFVDNAKKYGDGATAVEVEVDPETDQSHGVGPGRSVRIAVEDSGPGVPENQRDKIFDRFNRGDQGGSRGIDMGVGLGLALAAEHARLQGGRVWVEDRHDGGAGSRFVLELPVIEPVYSDDHEALSSVSPEEAEAFALTGLLPSKGPESGEAE